MSLRPPNDLVHTPSIPYDPSVGIYTKFLGFATPWEFSGLKDEVLSWKKTAYIHAGLNPSQSYRLTGPDALKLLKEHSTNSYEKYPIGSAKHVLMTDDDGLITAHGVVVREGDDNFMTYWLQPWIDYVVGSGEYNVTGEDLTGQRFLFQIGGPKSLEVLEAATGDDLRDIKFLRQRESTIRGTSITVKVLRLGMAGSLAYELHGDAADAHAVYNAVVANGEPLGLRRLGFGQYILNHTENGFPQGHQDFLYPWFEIPDLAAHLASLGLGNPPLKGSAGDNIRLRYRNPFEMGWGNLVKFDHDFQGRAALEKIAASPHRTIVTLSWNTEDILDVFRSQLEPGEEYTEMVWAQEPVFNKAYADNHADLILTDGQKIGISTGRGYSYYYRAMISIGVLDVSASEIGTEVVVLWGDDGGRQKEIRATVERYPFFNENRNETLDVSSLSSDASAPVSAH